MKKNKKHKKDKKNKKNKKNSNGGPAAETADAKVAPTSELIVGLVGAIGADMDKVAQALATAFEAVDHSCAVLKPPAATPNSPTRGRVKLPHPQAAGLTEVS